MLDLFDPARWQIWQFDQRGCGQSRPHAGDSVAALENNTLKDLVADIEALRLMAGVERWALVAGSWGVTLALAYAQAHPTRVSGCVLYAVATTTRREIAWITQGIGRFLPETYARFRSHVPEATRPDDVLGAYCQRLRNEDPAIHHPAAEAWITWEEASLAMVPGHVRAPRFDDPRYRLCFARLVTHVWHHAAWLEEDALLNGLPRLHHLPAWLIHGRLDLGSPVDTAYHLAQAWSGARLVVVDAAGHDRRHPALREATIAAIRQLHDRLTVDAAGQIR
jgi:proline iminopeptidase